MRRRSVVGHICVGLGAVGISTILLGAQAGAASSTVSQATAQDVNIALSGLSLGVPSPATSAASDGTGSTVTNTDAPGVSLLNGATFLTAGALATQATAEPTGVSYACAGIVQTGAALQVGAGGTSCTSTGTGTGGLSLDLSTIPGIGTTLSALGNVTITANAVTAYANEQANGDAVGGAVIANPELNVSLVGGFSTGPIPLMLAGTPNEDLLPGLVSVLEAYITANPTDAALPDPVVTALDTTLAPVVTLQTDYQTGGGAAPFEVSAIRASILNGATTSAGTADLAEVTVGPNTTPSSTSTTPPSSVPPATSPPAPSPPSAPTAPAATGTSPTVASAPAAAPTAARIITGPPEAPLGHTGALPVGVAVGAAGVAGLAVEEVIRRRRSRKLA